MTEYIKREDVMERVGRWQLNTREAIAEMIMSVPSADVVTREQYEQIHWERDVALHQLEEIGKGLGEKMVDVIERKRGKWQITDAYPHNVYCSECHKKFAQTHWAVWEDGSLPRNFCPNCGADMRHPDD